MNTQLTVSCQRCSDKHGSPPYIELLDTSTAFQPQAKPAHCPRCGKPKLARPHDWADVLCQTYFGLTRKNALSILSTYTQAKQSGVLAPENQRAIYSYTTQYTSGQSVAGLTVLVNERRQSAPAILQQFKQSSDALDYLDKQGAHKVLQRGYTAPIDATCRTCGGQFTYIRGIVDVQRTSRATPLHCIWCASTDLITTAEQTEDTAWTCLSINYKLPVSVVKLFYASYQASTKYPSFAAYMQSDETQQVLALLAADPEPVAS